MKLNKNFCTVSDLCLSKINPVFSTVIINKYYIILLSTKWWYILFKKTIHISILEVIQYYIPDGTIILKYVPFFF